MKTITFFSYKGGSGRTLTVANFAKYLSKFGKNVFLIDFDLDAPGLHHKFEKLDNQDPNREGLVHFLTEWQRDGFFNSECLTRRTLTVQNADPEGIYGSIHLLPAGQPFGSEYFSLLSNIDWDKVLHQGHSFFNNLKTQIASFKNNKGATPDYLLIDSRTGVSMISTLATITSAPEVVACLFLNNPESIQGAMAVMNNLTNANISAVPVLCRVPRDHDQWDIQKVVQKCNDAFETIKISLLQKEGSHISNQLRLEDISILHSHPSLEAREHLIIDESASALNPMYRDYTRLFSALHRDDELGAKICEKFDQAKANFLENPEDSITIMESLADTFPLPDFYTDLVTAYSQSDTPLEKRWSAAQIADEMGADLSTKPYISLIENPRSRSYLHSGQQFLDLAYRIWSSQKHVGLASGIELANCLFKSSNPQAGQHIHNLLIEACNGDADRQAMLLKSFGESRYWASAEKLIEKLSRPPEETSLLVAYAHVACSIPDPELANTLFAKEAISLLLEEDAILAGNVLQRITHPREQKLALLEDYFRSFILDQSWLMLAKLHFAYDNLDISLVDKAKPMLPDHARQKVIDEITKLEADWVKATSKNFRS